MEKIAFFRHFENAEQYIGYVQTRGALIWPFFTGAARYLAYGHCEHLRLKAGRAINQARIESLKLILGMFLISRPSLVHFHEAAAKRDRNLISAMQLRSMYETIATAIRISEG